MHLLTPSQFHLPECKYEFGDLSCMANGASVFPPSSVCPPSVITSCVIWFHDTLWRFLIRKSGILEQGSEDIHTQNRLPFCLSSCVASTSHKNVLLKLSYKIITMILIHHKVDQKRCFLSNIYNILDNI